MEKAEAKVFQEFSGKYLRAKNTNLYLVVQYLSEYLSQGFHWELRGIRDIKNSDEKSKYSKLDAKTQTQGKVSILWW